jgi:predicted nuclease of predicted toxin-antitoxin system
LNATRPAIPFFTDHNVPESVAKTLEANGHTVTRLRDVMPTNSADAVVAAACERAELVLITHDNDFKSMATRMRISGRRFRKLSHVRLGCRESRSASRIEAALSLIEHEWEVAQATTDKRLIIHIGDAVIRTHR